MSGEGRLDEAHWVRTVGAPRQGDPRDGELHQLFGPLPDFFDLEPCDEQDESAEDYVRYFRSDASSPITDAEGRTVWIYESRPDVAG